MAKLPPIKNPVLHAIESISVVQENREYFGMSGVGRKCAREQWYSWRWVAERSISARVNRIFRRGDLEEPRIVADLEAAGMEFYDDQYEVVHFTGHSKGHIDGKLKNVPGAEKTEHLAEFKTMKASKFNALKKKALLIGFEAALKELHSDYWCQIQIYMKYTELTRCLFVITNKDTEERMYERVHYYKEQAKLINARILDILSSEFPPARISEREDWFECKFCDFKEVCFKHLPALINCRTCRFANLFDNGLWGCSVNDNKELDKKKQAAGCELHGFLEDL